MPDSPTTPVSEGSHESGDERHDQSSKTPAAKDKECPYCHQHFTSSSLGRHLDQFLSKKKPDGIHDVDEIRKLRGGITRRTARNSKRDGHDGSSARTTPAAQQQQQYPLPARLETVASISDLNAIPPGGIQGRLNSLNWQSTGVITDPAVLNPGGVLPNTPSNPSYRSASPINNLKKRSFTTYADDLNPSNLTETARALELSLREVLDSLRAATKHASVPPSPFKFDIHSQTFPSLTLHLLPTPPTLNQASPFSTLATTPISAPGPDQLNPLRNQITNQIDMWKWQALRLAQRTTSNIADEADFLTRQAESYSQSAMNHLNTSFENWMAHPAEIRDLLWHVELLRAFQTQKDKVSDLEERMDELQQEANQLQQQIEYLSRCQWPREMALWPPDRHIFSRKMAEEVRLINLQKPISGSTNSESKREGGREDEVDANIQTENINMKGDISKWDFEKLVSKWRAHVREDKQRRTPYIQSTGGSNSNLNSAGASGNLSANTQSTTNNTGNAPGPGPAPMHWIGEKGARTSTPVQWISNAAKGDGDVNGVNGTGNGNGSPANGEERRKTRSSNWKNVSIISDFGGD